MKLKRKIYEFLDIGYRRALLGFLASIYSVSMYKTKRFCWIFHDGVWIHKYTDRFIAKTKKNFKMSVSGIVERTRNNCLYNYMPQKGDVIIDVGAGVGEETLVFSKSVGQNGKVISIEANPKTFLCLAKMCEYNKLDNVILLDCAITAAETDVFIEDIDEYKACRVNKKGNVKVKGRTLDNIANEFGIHKVDFLKMNIEGAEKIAIEGMSEVIQKTRFVCIAYHDFRAINEGLKKHGFLITTRESDKKESVRDYVYGNKETGQ